MVSFERSLSENQKIIEIGLTELKLMAIERDQLSHLIYTDITRLQ